jgi:hypothetical protein
MHRLAIVFMLALGFISISAAVNAGELDWITTKEQMSAMSRLASGYAGGLRSDRLINTDVASGVIDRAFPRHQFSPREVAQFADFVLGIVALEISMNGAGRESCRTVRLGVAATRFPTCWNDVGDVIFCAAVALCRIAPVYDANGQHQLNCEDKTALAGSLPATECIVRHSGVSNVQKS